MIVYDKTRYLYLASPYTHSAPEVRQWRYEQAVAATAILATKHGMYCFSPIAHSHYMSIAHEMPYTFEFWDEWNRAMILGSAGMIILKVEGWEESKGIAAEIKHCMEMGKPIDYFEWLHRFEP